jgi:hypothetical protein
MRSAIHESKSPARVRVTAVVVVVDIVLLLMEHFAIQLARILVKHGVWS